MKLNYKKTLLVGFAFFLISAFWMAYDTVIPLILTDKFGLPQSVSGLIMALDNILALFLLPLFGAFSDKSKSRFGRRTPFIFVGTLIACVFVMGVSFADNMQLANLKDISAMDESAMEILYEANPKIPQKDSLEKIRLQEAVSREDFLALTGVKDEEKTADMTVEEEKALEARQERYAEIVINARRAYAAQVTTGSPVALICFIGFLLILLVSMSTFRSPAVALMPDVTPKPLRSKANAVINLMGSFGGIAILVLGVIFGTSKVKNMMMSYTAFFGIVAIIMIVALVLFCLFVRERKWAAEMKAQSEAYGVEEKEDDGSGDRRLSRGELVSLILILSSVVLWFMGYNAVVSKFSVYSTSVLVDLDFNTSLIIAQAAAIFSYIPVGIIASKVGRKKCILVGVVMLAVSFFGAGFLKAGSSPVLVNGLFAVAGIGWATINVNSYPMVVELSKGSNVGKYTGFYYTASMLAQAITPVISGFFMDIKMESLFVYATVMVFAAFFTMIAVKHGDSKPLEKSEAK